MYALFENLKFEYLSNPQIKDYYLYQNINNKQASKENNFQQNILKNEEINKIVQSLKELNIKYLNERQKLLMNIKNSINSNVKNSQDEFKMQNIQESKDKKNKNVIDSLSEVKKFKTELCHSWELTGTCKYGLNVII